MYDNTFLSQLIMKGTIIISLLIFFFRNIFGFLPESIDKAVDEYSANISFILYTRNHGNNGSQMFLGDKESIKNSGLNLKLPVVLSTHGYLNDASKGCVQLLRNGFHARNDVNFIAIDWSKYSKAVQYEKAAAAVKVVGLYVSKFLSFLTSETGLKIEDFHFIGHSLGAHVASFASNEFEAKKIGRITGLDPAAPLMEKLPSEDRLDPKDAHFVDVIHTCIIFAGMRIPAGTVDFYPNGGMFQPGCNGDLSCSHNMSCHYFAKTVQTGKDYPAIKCDTLKDAENGNCNGETAPMGLGSKQAKPGIYYSKICEL